MKIKPLTDYSLFMFCIVLLAGVLWPVVASAETGLCKDKKMVVLGDSLVAGFDLPPGQSFPDRLSLALRDKGYGITIVNAGVSGDTSSGGLARLDWSVQPDTDAVLLELGANDALRGIPVDITRSNLDKILGRLGDRNVNILVAGMLAPPNMGEAYASEFSKIYQELSEKHEVMLYPFFLDGVAAQSELNLPDGIHPNEKGIAVMVERIMPTMEAFLATFCVAENKD